MDEVRTRSALPVPPQDLLPRIGLTGTEDPAEAYERTGKSDRRLIESVLPEDWSWSGKRVLDFGCGVGRVLRQFAPEADEAELWGCDLDGPSLAWSRENLEPPLRFFESAEAPGLPQEDGYFDLIYAFSVYTHLTDNWAGWLLEHHRTLAEDGILLATFLGEGMIEAVIGEEWDEDRIGMNPLRHDSPWDHGGPMTLNSPWWIRAHWGRAFEIIELRPRIVADGTPSQGLVVMRKKPVQLTVEELKRLEPDEPREIVALEHHAEQLIEESRELRGHAIAGAQSQRLTEQLTAEANERARELAAVKASLSWRLTAPLRAIKSLLNRHGHDRAPQ